MASRRDQPSRRVDAPVPGFFRLKLVKRGVFVGAQIIYAPTADPVTGEPLDRSWYWHGVLNGVPDPNPMPIPTPRTWQIWLHGDPIPEAEYRFLVADREWASENSPDSPEANPTKPVDFLTVNLPF